MLLLLRLVVVSKRRQSKDLRKSLTRIWRVGGYMMDFGFSRSWFPSHLSPWAAVIHKRIAAHRGCWHKRILLIRSFSVSPPLFFVSLFLMIISGGQIHKNGPAIWDKSWICWDHMQSGVYTTPMDSVWMDRNVPEMSATVFVDTILPSA